jgi:hypothetical protein
VHTLATHSQTEIELHWTHPVPGHPETRARQLRGSLARVFRDDDRFHQHDALGRDIYRYPSIQYRWHQGHGLIIGWRDTAPILRNLPWLDLNLSLGDHQAQVSDAVIACRNAQFGHSQQLEYYTLRSPLLLFNQENYQRYQTLPKEARQQEINRLLVAQLLTALRGLDVTFSDRLYAGFITTRPQKCRYKQQDLLGFSGQFVSNAILPAGFALGHAVSHGYGWVAPTRPTP